MYSLDHHDLGTPPSDSTETVTLTIDGVRVTVPAGTSVMRAAAMIDNDIPKLCATDNLKAFGSCRLCLVEIEGRKGFPASCTTEVAQNMAVRTHSNQLDKLRRGVMELYLSEHPPQLIIDSTPQGQFVRTELKAMAQRLGVTATRYDTMSTRQPALPVDDSNPYFTFDPNACIVCSRCVRACDEVQGTLALTIEGRGFGSRVSASQAETFLESECVSCGACVEACPTTALREKTLIASPPPEQAVTTTCAYCGVGCSFKAEVHHEQVVRMVPNRHGPANQGHACVKGRFAYGYATHADRILKPMIRSKITDPWQEVSWEEAIHHAASEFKRIQKTYGKDAVGGITSSRCTNEEAYLVQKLVRAAFGNNNVDTCARVCHSPTGYGLKQTLGESAGTQAFNSVMQADVVMVIGANPTEGHPVFASQLKRRLRQGAQLIVVDPREISLVRSPHIQAAYHLQLKPGTNVALMNALAHVVVTEGLAREPYIAERCEAESYSKWQAFVSHNAQSPEATASITGVPAEQVRAAARLYATANNGAIYYGLGVTEHSQGTTTVMAIANLAMVTGNIGRDGVGVNPLRGQNNVQGSCDMGSFPHELAGYRHISDGVTRSLFESAWQVRLDDEPGLRIPNMFEAALDGSFKGMYIQGEDMAQSDPNTQHVQAAFAAMECVVVQDLFLNETANYAHVLLPGSSFLEKDGTFTNAERRISRVRKIMTPRAGFADWEVTMMLSNALGYPMRYRHPSQIMDEIAALTPTFHGVNYDKLDQLGSVQWPCNANAPNGTPTMHIGQFVRGKGKFFVTEYVPTSERTSSRFPLLLTTGRVLTQYNVGAQTRRTANVVWHDEDVLEIHPTDAEARGVIEGDWVGVASRAGETVLHATVTERVQPGVVYTTFHFPESGANVVTTENSDWATNCPEYKVTAVQVVKVTQPSAWQQRHRELANAQRTIQRTGRGGSRATAECSYSQEDLATVSRVPVQRWRDDRVESIMDAVAEEQPVALTYQGVPHVVMMATPQHLQDLGVGFTLSEGIVRDAGEIHSVELFRDNDSLEVRMSIAAERFTEVLKQQRNLTGRTGCGVCGAATVAQVVRHPAPVTASLALSNEELHVTLAALQTRQSLNLQTGSVHAAAWCVPGKGIALIREDVGRHNALDKLIGALVQQRCDVSQGYVVITSRASYEMVQKAATVGVSLLVAVSAPTALAIRLAEETGMTLVGFARPHQHVVYTHPRRLIHV